MNSWTLTQHVVHQGSNWVPPTSLVEFRCVSTEISIWEVGVSFDEIFNSTLCGIG